MIKIILIFYLKLMIAQFLLLIVFRKLLNTETPFKYKKDMQNPFKYYRKLVEKIGNFGFSV